jgi:hypothetical protein
MYIIDIDYAYFGIEIEKGKCVSAPPIGKWMIGQPLFKIMSWVNKKKGKVTQAQYTAINNI